MKICNKCGTKIPDDDSFCYKCGARVVENHKKPEQSPIPAAAPESAEPPQPAGKTRPRKYLWLLLTVIVVVVGGGLAGFLIFGKGDTSAAYTQKLEEANKYVSSGNYDTAIKAYDEAIAISPKKPDAYIGKADVQVKKGDIYSAILTLREGSSKATETKGIKKKLKAVEREYEGEWKTAYKAVLQDNEYDIKEYENMGNYDFITDFVPHDSAALCDIDGDGIPELFFITNGQDYQNSGLHIFKYKDGKAQEISYSVSDRSTYKEGIAPRDHFNHGLAGGEEHGYIIFTSGDTLAMLSKHTDEHVAVDINQYRSSDDTSLDMIGYMGFFWSMVDNPGKSKVDLSTAEIITDKGPGTKESYEKEYKTLCDGMTDVIFYERDGQITDDERIWNLAESKGKLSMTYDEMIKELEKVPEKAVAGQADDKVLGELTGDTMSLSSGAGGWSTDIEFKENGKFIGSHHDSNMGETGPRYLNGTIYSCNFEGKFGSPRKVGEKEYELTLEELRTEKFEDKITMDGVMHRYSEPYGFEGIKPGDKVKLYAPGYPIDKFSEENRQWFIGRGIETGQLEGYCILINNHDSDTDYDYLFI